MHDENTSDQQQPSLDFPQSISQRTAPNVGSGFDQTLRNASYFELHDYQEIFLPVHDFPRYTSDELTIINHPAFQRLRRVYQLGLAHLVFPGATHKRFEHSLGTVWIAQKMIDAINDNFRRSLDNNHNDESECKYDFISERETRFIRLAALLHDIGHVPAGHTLEDELCILEKHDSEKRLKDVLDKEDWIKGVKSEKLSKVIGDRYNSYLPAGAEIKSTDILLLLISKESNNDPRAVIQEIKIKVGRDIVGNTICADLLDYLYRDWHHIGKPRYFDTRFLQYMQVRQERLKSESHLVISVGTPQRPRYDAVTSILHLLEIRYELAESVIFHPTKCSAAAMLERALGELNEAVPTKQREAWDKHWKDRLLHDSDESFFDTMLDAAEKYKSDSAKSLFQHLLGRQLYKGLLTISAKDISDSSESKIVHTYTGKKPREEKPDPPDAEVAAVTRLAELRQFESQLGLPAGSVVMYCPLPQMNSKIAQVKIILDDVIKTLSQWDEENERIASSYTKAQLERFKRLWRVQIYVSPLLREKLVKDQEQGGENIFLLEAAARLFLLGNTQPGRSLLLESWKWARQMSTQVRSFMGDAKSPFEGRTVRSLNQIRVKLAAQGGLPGKCPMGAPRITNLFSDD